MCSRWHTGKCEGLRVASFWNDPDPRQPGRWCFGTVQHYMRRSGVLTVMYDNERAVVQEKLNDDEAVVFYSLDAAFGRSPSAGSREQQPNVDTKVAVKATEKPKSGGAGRWPKHGLDLDLLGRGWPAPPTADDLAEAALMQRFLGDLATHRGTLPAAWAWPPVAGPGAPADGALYTMVFALPSGFPGGGTRAVSDFKAAQCGPAVLGQLAGQAFWWVD